MDRKIISQLLSRKQDSNKYDFGHVLIFGGSPGMIGAPFLAALGALRIGAGLVTIASSTNVINKLEKRVVEIMTLRVPQNDQQAEQTLFDFIQGRRVSVLVVGSGMNPELITVVKNLFNNISIPVLLDAGAIVGFQGSVDQLRKYATKFPIVLTPHAGEYAKLTSESLPDDFEARKNVVSNFSKQNHLTLVCKGSPTLVGHSDGALYENTTGNPGLATAGTGDVLAGVISGLIAQSLSTNQAADIGTYLHGMAADIAIQDKTQPGLIASDIVAYLPDSLKQFSKP